MYTCTAQSPQGYSSTANGLHILHHPPSPILRPPAKAEVPSSPPAILYLRVARMYCTCRRAGGAGEPISHLPSPHRHFYQVHPVSIYPDHNPIVVQAKVSWEGLDWMGWDGMVRYPVGRYLIIWMNGQPNTGGE